MNYLKNLEYIKRVVIKNINTYIKLPQNKFFIFYVDKSPCNYVIVICVEHYKHLLHNAINRNNIFNNKTSLKILINNIR